MIPRRCVRIAAQVWLVLAMASCTQFTNLDLSDATVPVPGGQVELQSFRVVIESIEVSATGSGSAFSRSVPGPITLDVLAAATVPPFGPIDLPADTYSQIELAMDLRSSVTNLSTIEARGIFHSDDGPVPLVIRIDSADSLASSRSNLQVTVGLRLDVTLSLAPARWLPQIDLASANRIGGEIVIDEATNPALRDNVVAALRASVQVSLSDGTFGQ